MTAEDKRFPIDPNHLTDHLGLTSAEARVAAGLAHGLSTAEMARRFGVQPNTIRAHLKRALAKSGVRRQTELVARLWRLAFEQRCKAQGGQRCDACRPCNTRNQC